MERTTRGSTVKRRLMASKNAARELPRGTDGGWKNLERSVWYG